MGENRRKGSGERGEKEKAGKQKETAGGKLKVKRVSIKQSYQNNKSTRKRSENASNRHRKTT